MLKSLRFLVCIFCSLCLCAPFFPATLHAQSAAPAPAPSVSGDSPDADDDSDDQQPASNLITTISFSGSGKLTVNANAFLPDRNAAGASELKAALQEALACSLIDSARLHPTPNFYVGYCTLPHPASTFLRQGDISIGPLRRYCDQHAVETLTVELHFPDADVTEAIPPAAVPSFPFKIPGKNGEWLRKYMRLTSNYTWQLSKPIPAAIEYRFGYPPSKVQRGALFLFLILLAPLALLSWLGRKALSADIPDKAVVWFSYMRSLSWILNGSLLFWWAALDYFQVEPILRFLASGTSFDSFLAHPVAAQMIGWVPPSLAWLLCFRLSHPIQQKLRGLSWTKRELTLQSLYTLLAGLFPLAMFLTGINLLTSHSATASVWFLAAFVVRVFAAQALLKLNGMQPHALTSGDLRDRAFAMADQLGVKLQQVYLISSGKGQIANAFASLHDHISFTDFLLQRMSRREVDYVMAHELTHLKLKHPSKLGMARFVAFFLGLILLTALLVFLPGPNFTLVRYLVMFGIMTALPFVISRRFEYAADAGAVTTTGDPRTAISALFKLAQLNMLPFQWSKWSEKWLTHPSSLRRAQAIAQKAGIPFEEIPVIARDGSGEACTYSPQSTAAPKNKLHSTQHKKASIQKLSYMLLAILSFVPSFFALAAQHLPRQHALQLSLFALSIPATFAAVLLLSNYIPCLTRGNLAARLDEKLTAQGIQVNSWAGICVGFSPAAAPRSYESNSFWDIGYLFFRSDRICYWGEEIQFSLRRDQITDIKLDTGLPGFLGSKRVYIAWRDDELGSCGVFNLGRGHADSVRSGSRQTKQLADRLQIWWKTPSLARPLPPPLDTLSSPVARAVTSAIPGAMWKSGKLVRELLATAWISSLAAMLCGLPFHLFAYLAQSSNARIVLRQVYDSPGAGWFVVLAAPMVRFLSLIPALRYRDKPILIAQSPVNSRSAASASTDPSPSTSFSRDPVSIS